MTPRGQVTKAWLLARLAECDSLSGQAFAFVAVLERLTGQTWVWARGQWSPRPAPPPAARDFATWQAEVAGGR